MKTRVLLSMQFVAMVLAVVFGASNVQAQTTDTRTQMDADHELGLFVEHDSPLIPPASARGIPSIWSSPPAAQPVATVAAARTTSPSRTGTPS